MQREFDKDEEKKNPSAKPVHTESMQNVVELKEMVLNKTPKRKKSESRKIKRGVTMNVDDLSITFKSAIRNWKEKSASHVKGKERDMLSHPDNHSKSNSNIKFRKLDSSIRDVSDLKYRALLVGKKTVHRRRSLNFYQDLEATESLLTFMQEFVLQKLFASLSGVKKRLFRAYYDELIMRRNVQNDQKVRADKEEDSLTLKGEKRPRGLGPWELLWEYKRLSLSADSPYRDFPSFRVRQMVVKGNDDLRQEVVAMQLITKFKEIFKKEGTNLFVYSYEIVAIDANSGTLEFIQDSISLDGVKKIYNGLSLVQIYRMIFGRNFDEAQKHFIESLAAYSIICYVLQIKDR